MSRRAMESRAWPRQTMERRCSTAAAERSGLFPQQEAARQGSEPATPFRMIPRGKTSSFTFLNKRCASPGCRQPEAQPNLWNCPRARALRVSLDLRPFGATVRSSSRLCLAGHGSWERRFSTPGPARYAESRSATTPICFRCRGIRRTKSSPVLSCGVPTSGAFSCRTRQPGSGRRNAKITHGSGRTR